MRRNARRHADCDTLRTVDQKVRDAAGQNGRLLFRLIEVRDKVHDILIQIFQKGVLRQLFQACLRISHRSRTVTLNIAEIAVSID